MTTELMPAGWNPIGAAKQTENVPLPDTEYAHAAGRIRALETVLMDRSQTHRLTEAEDTVEFGRYLADAGYPLADTNGLSLIGRVVAAGRLVRDLAPEKAYIDYFFHRSDVMNAKVFLKYHVGLEQIPFEALDRRIMKPSSIPPQSLFEALRDWDRSVAAVPDWLWTAARDAYESYTASGDSAKIDICLETAFAKEERRVAETLGNSWFSKFLTMRTDMTNMEVLFRRSRTGFSPEFAAESLLPGGTVSREELEKRLLHESGDLSTLWSGTPYERLAATAVAEYSQPGGPAQFGKQADDLLMDHVKLAHRIAFGPEVLVAYLYAVTTEVRNARMVLTFLRNRLDPARAREYLREPYV